MQQARNEADGKSKTTSAPGGKADAAGRDGGSKRAALRGMDFAAQEAALAPGGAKGAESKAGAPGKAGAEVKADGKTGPVWGGAAAKAVPEVQPGPHAAKIDGSGRWVVSVVSKSAAFSQKLGVSGAAQGNTEMQVSGGETFEVESKGAFELAVQHSPGKGMKWAGPRAEGQWYRSTHQRADVGPDEVQVRTEDFNDHDFDDLIVHATRAPGDVGEDGAYLVESETRIDGMVTSYDLILGASASGRVDVVLNAAMLSHGELGGLDAMTLEALSTKLSSFASDVGSSKEHADKRASLMAQIAAWQAAVAKALAAVKAGGKKSAGESKDAGAATKPAASAKAPAEPRPKAKSQPA
jgi:hypothetical protein